MLKIDYENVMYLRICCVSFSAGPKCGPEHKLIPFGTNVFEAVAPYNPLCTHYDIYIIYNNNNTYCKSFYKFYILQSYLQNQNI